MTIIIRKSKERGHADHGWLKSAHTFSFANYHDPKWMHFRALRVINDDRVAPKKGFDFHPHNTMEIITYMIKGSLTHRDNLGNEEVIHEGQVQIMSAGSGIIHSEYNETNEPCHLLQIWILPNEKSGTPYYKIFTPDHLEKWGLAASENGQDNAVKIRQNAQLYILNSGALSDIDLPQTTQKHAWIHIATGKVKIGNLDLEEGDAIGLTAPHEFSQMAFIEPSKVLVFYLD